MSDLLAAAERRAERLASADRPAERRWGQDAAEGRGRIFATLSVREITTTVRDGRDVVAVGGYASTTEDPYEMYDAFGKYSEIVSAGAFGQTLAASPQVEFTLNHGKSGWGTPMAHTRNSTLVLQEDGTGLGYDAYVDPTRADVADMLKAMERGDLAEASFKFRIDSGIWSPDYTEFRINAADIHRGDVSAVNFGANPNASSGVRSEDLTLQADNFSQLQAMLTEALRQQAFATVPPLTPVRISDEDTRLRAL